VATPATAWQRRQAQAWWRRRCRSVAVGEISRRAQVAMGATPIGVVEQWLFRAPSGGTMVG